jgi:hypothetical protein
MVSYRSRIYFHYDKLQIDSKWAPQINQEWRERARLSLCVRKYLWLRDLTCRRRAVMFELPTSYMEMPFLSSITNSCTIIKMVFRAVSFSLSLFFRQQQGARLICLSLSLVVVFGSLAVWRLHARGWLLTHFYFLVSHWWKRAGRRKKSFPYNESHQVLLKDSERRVPIRSTKYNSAALFITFYLCGGIMQATSKNY